FACLCRYPTGRAAVATHARTAVMSGHRFKIATARQTVGPLWKARPMHADLERATQPEDLSRLIVERLNAGDVDGLVALDEPDAVLALPDGQIAIGSEGIRRAYERLVGASPTFEPGTQQPTLRSGDLALTSSRLANGVMTVEVARRQADDTWLWVIDQPNVIR